jgi:hypothetical protein
MHSAPPARRVKTRVFRDCRFPENRRPDRRPGLPPAISPVAFAAQVNSKKPAFTEENTYQKPAFPGLP